MKRDFICGLDIGEHKSCASCGVIQPNGKIDILGSQTIASEGIAGGRIIDERKVSACIRDVIKRLHKICGIKVRRIYVNINSPDLRVKGVGEKVALDRRVVYLKESRGDIVTVSALIPTIRSFVKCIKDAGLALEGIVPSGCAQALGFFRDIKGSSGKRSRVLIDAGAGLTKINLFKDGLIRDIVTLPLGAQAITEDVAVKLKLSFDCAEEAKVKYGRVHFERAPVDQKIIVKDKLLTRVIERRQLDEIILPRVDYLLQKIKKALRALDCRDEEINELIIGGAGAMLEGFLERAQRILEKPVKMGFLYAVNDSRIQSQSALYATSIGLIHYGFKNKGKKVSLEALESFLLKRIANRVKTLYREYF